jgi:hypothetical protein
MEQETPSMSDTVKMIRCVLKVSSAFNDIDQLISDKTYFKFDFKRKSRDWLLVMESHTKQIMDGLAEENTDLLGDLYTAFEESLENIAIPNEKREPLVRFYIKLRSCLNDIESMDEAKDRVAPLIIKIMTLPVLDTLEKQYPDVIKLVDKNGKTTIELIEFLDNFGQSIAYLENEGNNDNGEST